MLKRLLWLVVLVLVAGGIVTSVMYLRINEPYRGYSASEQFVEIPSGRQPRRRSSRAAGVCMTPRHRTAL
jgi:hypothetical protein